jgi:hypothetical protein
MDRLGFWSFFFRSCAHTESMTRLADQIVPRAAVFLEQEVMLRYQLWVLGRSAERGLGRHLAR